MTAELRRPPGGDRVDPSDEFSFVRLLKGPVGAHFKALNQGGDQATALAAAEGKGGVEDLRRHTEIVGLSEGSIQTLKAC